MRHCRQSVCEKDGGVKGLDVVFANGGNRWSCWPAGSRRPVCTQAFNIASLLSVGTYNIILLTHKIGLLDCYTWVKTTLDMCLFTCSFAAAIVSLLAKDCISTTDVQKWATSKYPLSNISLWLFHLHAYCFPLSTIHTGYFSCKKDALSPPMSVIVFDHHLFLVRPFLGLVRQIIDAREDGAA